MDNNLVMFLLRLVGFSRGTRNLKKNPQYGTKQSVSANCNPEDYPIHLIRRLAFCYISSFSRWLLPRLLSMAPTWGDAVIRSTLHSWHIGAAMPSLLPLSWSRRSSYAARQWDWSGDVAIIGTDLMAQTTTQGSKKSDPPRWRVFGMYCRAIKNSATTLNKLARR